MENLDVLIMYAIPAVVAIICVLQIMKGLTEREKIKSETVLATKKVEKIYPLQLQAYERLCMLMERLSPDNLILRINKSFAEINQEFNHNISQQVYISDKAWAAIKRAVEMLKSTINKSAAEVSDNEGAVSTHLARRVLENFMHEKNDPIQEALKILRNEIKRL